MTTAELARAIRAKLFDSLTPRMQSDLGRMAHDLRQQGASEESITDQLEAVIEMQQLAVLDVARTAAADIARSGFQHDERARHDARRCDAGRS